MNSENLTPFGKGEDRAKAAGRKGGVASGKARRERFRELLLAELDRVETFAPAAPKGMTRRAYLAQRLVNAAAMGNLKALQLVLKLTGEDGAEAEEAQTA